MAVTFAMCAHTYGLASQPVRFQFEGCTTGPVAIDAAGTTDTAGTSRLQRRIGDISVAIDFIAVVVMVSPQLERFELAQRRTRNEV